MHAAYSLARRIALAGMGVSAALAVLKISIGVAAGSEATLADGVESAADVLASGMLVLGLTLAARPADEDHPYGHGRFEALRSACCLSSRAVESRFTAFRRSMSTPRLRPLTRFGRC